MLQSSLGISGCGADISASCYHVAFCSEQLLQDPPAESLPGLHTFLEGADNFVR